MKTKEFITTAMMLALGLILHFVVPPIFNGMKPDLLLIFLALAIVLAPNVKNTLVAGFGGGALSAMTTSFPGGQLPNVIDKVVTALVILALIKLMASFKNEVIKSAIITGLATLVSGTVFLSSALIIVGLPAPFMALFVSVVIPALVANVVIGVIVFKAVLLATRSRAVV